ncbi:hypothetical protein F5878DRAFT_511339, partial [Lentinula raphanica]
INAFIKTVLRYTPDDSLGEGGILGHVSAYYGCVEAQGRGTLHCHMLIWLHGALNPNQIKDKVKSDLDIDFQNRMINFLNDTISSNIVPDPDTALAVQSSVYHPCSVRGLNPVNATSDFDCSRQKDMHHLTKCCQTHKHTFTCYKYWKGPPEPRVCRFDLDQLKINMHTFFDPDTGELHLRKLDGLVNDYNETISECVRCNTDIKFIGSGPFAKAVMYYVTDYITKTQLKAHVAYAALEVALRRLEPLLDPSDNVTITAKRLLQRCSYAMINQQELSAQQVMSYLMDFGDHYTSHSYNNLYWTSFEFHVNFQSPSPECYLSQNGTEVKEGSQQNNISADQHLTDYNNSFDDSEVSFTISADKQMKKMASQVEDYIYRSD